ncbi:MAG TPA: Gfo/Idh/MocA family oxidoreductase [bacterium]|nr:Gfo/Idh/MocA family oxidoreductase [bacterium]
MDQVRWGVLGVANIGMRVVLPAIQQSRNGRIVAIASRDAARAAEAAHRLGIARAYGSYAALLDDHEVQAVYVPLPNTLHHEWVLRCAAAGKHVLCEKPLTTSPENAQEMIAACARAGVRLMEAFMYRFHPRTERVVEMVARGVVGVPRLLRASFTFPVREPSRNIRFDPALGGGSLYDVGCYAVNVTRMLLGDPEQAFARGYVGESGVDELVGAVLLFGSGRVALLDCGLTMPRREEYEVVGTEGRLTIPKAFLPGTGDAEIHLTRGAERTVLTVPGVNQYQLMVERFADAVLQEADVPYPPGDAVGTLRVITALLTSMRTGRPAEP